MAEAHPQHGSSDIAASSVLLIATAAALVIANSPWAGIYYGVLNREIDLSVGALTIANDLKYWIKDALMAIFFLYVGLEIKSEFKQGALSTRKSATLPFIAAVGGMVVPALVYLSVSGGDPEAVRGWAIPAATDIAFAVGLLGLLGRRVSPSLKAFILAVAVIDDLGAIVIIALFYTASIALLPLQAAALVTIGLVVLNWRNVEQVWPYMVGCAALWVCLQQSGVSPTLAGVIAALCVPLRDRTGVASPLMGLMERLRLPVTFLIMPVFAFAFAGVPLSGLSLDVLSHPITAGIWLGLFIGKPVGITLAVWLTVRAGWADLPRGADLLQVFGVGCIAGIGFTMSLFIGVLAFGDGALLDYVRIGVLGGSMSAALIGSALLVLADRRRRPVRA